jgi:hypothetical protein
MALVDLYRFDFRIYRSLWIKIERAKEKGERGLTGGGRIPALAHWWSTEGVLPLSWRSTARCTRSGPSRLGSGKGLRFSGCFLRRLQANGGTLGASGSDDVVYGEFLQMKDIRLSVRGGARGRGREGGMREGGGVAPLRRYRRISAAEIPNSGEKFCRDSGISGVEV